MILTSVKDLPNIERPEKDLTLNKLINFYNITKKISRILPTFIRNSLKNNEQNNIQKAKNFFILLLNSYYTFNYNNFSINKNSSFLCHYINEFLDTFEIIVSKLIKAGLILVKLLLKRYSILGIIVLIFQ